MDKPVKKIKEYYNFFEAMSWLEKKHNFKCRDIVDDEGVSHDFWHFLIDTQCIRQESWCGFTWDMLYEEDDEYEYPEWAKVVIRYFLEEFGEEEYWVSW